jgi:hypothetical protein
MQIVIVAPCLLAQTSVETQATPPQLAMHLAASTPVRHRVKIVDDAGAAFSCTDQADLYVLLWSYAYSPLFIENALQLATCEPLVCVWDGPLPAPMDYLLEFCDHMVYSAQGAWWPQLLTRIEHAQRQPVCA